MSAQRRPRTAGAYAAAQGNALPLHYSLNSTSVGGVVGGGAVLIKPGGPSAPPLALSATTATDTGLSATAEFNLTEDTQEDSGDEDTNKDTPTNDRISTEATMSNKVRRNTTLSATGMNTTTNTTASNMAALAQNSEEVGAAAVASKMIFEKFLLRLEVVALYSTWLNVEQVTSFNSFLLFRIRRLIINCDTHDY